MALTSGWCEVNDDFKLAFEDSEFNVDFESVDDQHYPQDISVAFDYGTIKRTFKLKNIRFSSLSDVQSMLDKFKDLSKAGSPYKVEWTVHSTPSYFKFDGDTAYMMCLCRSIRGLSQESKGDQGIFLVKEILFVEGSKS